jgi:exodeoxyribonuclease-1
VFILSQEFLAVARKFLSVTPSDEQASEAYDSMSDEYKSNVDKAVFIDYIQCPSNGSYMMHDYEGGGVDGIKSGATQFAGVRVNMDLEPLDLPIDIYCKPNIDRLPSLDAVLITRITPLHCLKKGVNEFEFFKMINEEMSLPYTCTAGFNSVSYDDVMSRSGFYSNLLPVYDREWKNGNSRWDIYRVAMAYYALRPNGIVWPEGEGDKQASLRLERIAEVNDIVQENSHNAVDDVFAMIDVCRLFMKANRRLWDYLYSNRTKANIQKFIADARNKNSPLIYINPYVGVNNRFISVVHPINARLHDKNEVAFIELQGDVKSIFERPVDATKELLYSSKEILAQANQERPCLGKVKINQVPIILPISVIGDERVRSLAGIDIDVVKKNLAFLLAKQSEVVDLASSIYGVVESFEANHYIEDRVYSSGFPSSSDMDVIHRIFEHGIESTVSAGGLPLFSSQHLNELLDRLCALHYPTLTTEENLAQFKALSIEKLTSPLDSDRVTINEIESALKALEGDEREFAVKLAEEYREYLDYVKDWVAD